MTLPTNWVWWGLGWLFMPRMVIGILIGLISNHTTLGLVLAILGAIIDVCSD